MTSDDMLKNVVIQYDSMHHNDNYRTNEHCEAVLYMCIEGNSAYTNEFAIMTVNESFFCFYTLTMLAKIPFQVKHIKHKRVVPYSSITKIKTSKFFIWQNVKIWANDNGRKYKLALTISYKALGLERQRDNVLWLVDFIKEKGLNQ